MKNFQVKHGQCDGIIFPKTFSFKSFRQLLDLCYAGSRILYYWNVLESFHTFLGVISQCAPLLAPFRKGFPLSFSWPRRKYTWTLSWKESSLFCFENCQGVPYSHRQSRSRMMNTFIIVNITPRCKRYFRG